MAAAAPEDGPQLPAETGLHEHVQELAVLERLEELDNELAVGLLHDLLLCTGRVRQEVRQHTTHGTID